MTDTTLDMMEHRINSKNKDDLKHKQINREIKKAIREAKRKIDCTTVLEQR